MKHLLLVPLIATLAACGGGSHSPSSRPDRVPTPPVATLQDGLQGTWQQQGYGRVLKVTGSTVSLFDITSQTCVLIATEEHSDFSGVRLSDDGTGFTIRDSKLSFKDSYTRVAEPPSICDRPLGDSPPEIFEHTWHTFNDYYAFFEERDVDWLAQWDAIRDLVSDDLSEPELFNVLSQLLSPLDDEHVQLTSQDTTFSPASPKGFLLQLIDEYEQQDDVESFHQYLNQQLHRWDRSIREGYLNGTVNSAAGGTFLWGIIDERVGYLRIDAMIVDLDTPIDEQLLQVENVLDQVFTDLAHTESLIVDIRLNGGGTDAVSFAIARRFADTERLVVSKYTRTTAGEGALESMRLGPVDRPGYLGPVLLLTSGFTTSAAEVFTLAMRAWPQVTHIGESTNGSISDALDKPLPNGWVVSLSNEVYLDAAGDSHEAKGILPQLTAPVFGLEERSKGQDSALNFALELLGLRQYASEKPR